MGVNDDFDLGEDLGLNDPIVQQIKKKARAEHAKKAAPKKAAPKEVPEEPVVDEIASADPNKGKIRIMIDEIAGMSNYEVIGVNGRVIQIKRGTSVWVGPEYVHVLETALMTHVEHKVNRMTGETEETRKTFSAVPWRRM